MSTASQALSAIMAARMPVRMCRACREQKPEPHFSMCDKPFKSYKGNSEELVCNECITMSPSGTGFFSQPVQWMRKGLCFGVDKETAELFFPKNARELSQQAWSSLCVDCPMRAQCAQWGETINGEGVFGGEFRTFSSERESKPIEEQPLTVAGNPPGWRLLERGECRKGHAVLTSNDILVRTKTRHGVVRIEGECYHCFKVTRNKTQAKRRKAARNKKSGTQDASTV